jgi:histone acetyltransferase (RNA polymerase elongator complex component)
MTGEKLPDFRLLKSLEIDESIDEIAFYGGTFTGLSKEVMKNLLEIYPDIPKRISTSPNCINEEVVEILKCGNVKVVELGVESLDNEVLETSNRGYKDKDVINAIKLLRNDFHVIAHMMVGLPKDTKKKDLTSVEKLIELGVKNYRIHPTIIFKHTVLEQMYLHGKYTPLTLEESVDIVSDMIILIESNNGSAIRLGYHVPENQKQFIVTGPYHPSFGDMVRSRIIKKIIEELKVKLVEFNKKYEPWFNAYENKGLNIEKRIITQEDMFFDGISYVDALRKLSESRLIRGEDS